jgi:hypothetical protein
VEIGRILNFSVRERVYKPTVHKTWHENDIVHFFQYLDEDKKIEEDADIRKLLLEALLQLCSTKKAREIIRDQNAYLILRELHKIESDETVKLACENVIDILIKKEDEIKFDNYKTVEVPEDLHEKFDKELELEKSEKEKDMEKSEK